MSDNERDQAIEQAARVIQLSDRSSCRALARSLADAGLLRTGDDTGEDEDGAPYPGDVQDALAHLQVDLDRWKIMQRETRDELARVRRACNEESIRAGRAGGTLALLRDALRTLADEWEDEANKSHVVLAAVTWRYVRELRALEGGKA